MSDKNARIGEIVFPEDCTLTEAQKEEMADELNRRMRASLKRAMLEIWRHGQTTVGDATITAVE